jgi:hypothetical protein
MAVARRLKPSTPGGVSCEDQTLQREIPGLVLRALNDSGSRLTKTARGLIAAPMINAATILIARRRRTVAVWADICV